MKKRLLLGLMAACAVVSSFADNVNTKYGSYVTTSANLCTNGTFANANFDGWTAVSATAGTACSALFTYNAETQAISSTSNLYSEGMYYKFSASASSPSVVSFKIRQQNGAWPYSTNVRYTTTTADNGTETNTYGCSGNAGAGKNYISLFGNNGGVDSGTDFIQTGYAIQLTADWQTVTFATEADGIGRDWYLYICNMSTDIEIKDIEIYSAVEVADVRKAAEPLAFAKAVVGAYSWPSSDELVGLQENIEAVENITAENGAEDLADALEGLQQALDDFVSTNLDDYLATCTTGSKWADVNAKGQKIKTIGDWTTFDLTDEGRVTGTDRMMHCNSNDADVREATKHYISLPDYGYGSALGARGIIMTKDLNAGSYIFTMKGNCHTNYASNTPFTGADGYQSNDGFETGRMVISILNEAGAVVAQTTTNLPVKTDEYAQAVLVADITSDGKYSFVVDLSQPTENEYYGTNRNYGGSFYLSEPQIYSKLQGYNANQRAYIANVKAQINAGRTNYDTAVGYLADANYLWGKADLQTVVNEKLSVLQKYEAMSDDAIVNTYDAGIYVAGPTNENALLEHEVYVELAQGLIAANRKFVAVNDTLNSLGTAIENAKSTLTARVYDSATGKADFQSVISSAEALDAEMKAADYSEENAQTIEAKKAELAEATEVFKASVPASSVTVLADIDFSTPATTASDGTISIAGAVNSMVLPNYNTDEEDQAATNSYYYQGFWNNGEKVYGDMLRVGNGEATVAIPAAQQAYGTNILKLTFDYYFARLTQTTGSPGGTYSGYYIYDADGEKIAQLYYSPYWSAVPSEENNTFGLDVSGTYLPSVGASTAQNDAIAAESNVTHFEVIIDYGEKSMYCTTTTSKGVSQTSSKFAFNGAPVASFAVVSTHANAARRCWFDNLKIEQIAAGPADEWTGVKEVNTAEQTVVPVKKVIKDGRIVINGKYGLNGIVIK